MTNIFFIYIVDIKVEKYFLIKITGTASVNFSNDATKKNKVQIRTAIRVEFETN